MRRIAGTPEQLKFSSLKLNVAERLSQHRNGAAQRAVRARTWPLTSRRDALHPRNEMRSVQPEIRQQPRRPVQRMGCLEHRGAMTVVTDVSQRLHVVQAAVHASCAFSADAAVKANVDDVLMQRVKLSGGEQRHR